MKKTFPHQSPADTRPCSEIRPCRRPSSTTGRNVTFVGDSMACSATCPITKCSCSLCYAAKCCSATSQRGANDGHSFCSTTSARVTSPQIEARLHRVDGLHAGGAGAWRARHDVCHRRRQQLRAPRLRSIPSVRQLASHSQPVTATASSIGSFRSHSARIGLCGTHRRRSPPAAPAAGRHL